MRAIEPGLGDSRMPATITVPASRTEPTRIPKPKNIESERVPAAINATLAAKSVVTLKRLRSEYRGLSSTVSICDNCFQRYLVNPTNG